MNPEDLQFCIEYENAVATRRILEAVQEILTEKGLDALKSCNEFLSKNLDKYLTITGRT